MLHHLKEYIEDHRVHLLTPEARHETAQAKLDALEPFRLHLSQNPRIKSFFGALDAHAKSVADAVFDPTSNLNELRAELHSEARSLFQDIMYTMAWHRAEWHALFHEHMADIKADIQDSEFFGPIIDRVEYKAYLLEQKLVEFKHSDVVQDIVQLFDDLIEAIQELHDKLEGPREHVRARLFKLLGFLDKYRGILAPEALLLPYEMMLA